MCQSLYKFLSKMLLEIARYLRAKCIREEISLLNTVCSFVVIILSFPAL